MLSKIYHFVMDKKIPTLASAIAFSLIMNGGAFLFLFIIISGIVIFKDIALKHHLTSKL